MVPSILTPCKRAASFPAVLHHILSNPDCKHIITWLPHGRAWRVLDSAAFEKYIIPKYFRHNNFSSFLRQVSGWGFCRVVEKDEKRSYQHKVRILLFMYLCRTNHVFLSTCLLTNVNSFHTFNQSTLFEMNHICVP